MDFGLVFLTFTTLWKLSSSVITCYICSPEFKETAPGAPLCDHFDPSDTRFHQECDYSTMCYKKESSFDRGSEVTKTVERGCASQTWAGEQVKKNGKWRSVKNIHEDYNEGCEEDPTNSLRSIKTTNCFCRGNHCNNSRKLIASSWTIVLMLILMYLHEISHLRHII